MREEISRRRFMGSAFGAAAVPALMNPLKLIAHPLVADPQYEEQIERPDQPVRMGIIGVGGRGTTLLKSVLRSNLAEVVAICDIRPEAIESATALCKGMSPRGYELYTDLLEHKDLEAVFIATPVDLHRDMAVAAVAAGVHIYCEKPLGLSANNAQDIYEAAISSEKVFQVGFQWVYDRNFRASIEAVHDGLIGEVRFISGQRHGGDVPHKKWLMDRRRSGDIIVEQAVHEMNIMCWGMRSHPVSSLGIGGINKYVNIPEGRSVMDNYSVSFEFPGGCNVSYSHLFFSNIPNDGFKIYFYGEKGCVDVGGGQIYLDDGSTPEPRAMRLGRDSTFNAVASFFGKVRSGEPADSDVRKAMLATKMAVLGRTAIYQRERVNWDEIV